MGSLSGGRNAVLRPNEVCLGCHTDGPTFGTGDPLYQPRPNATPVGNHASLVTGGTRFTYGHWDAPYPSAEFEQRIECTTCPEPHRTYDGPGSSTNNIMYIRDHTDDYQVDSFYGWVNRIPAKTLKVIDNTGPTPVEVIKTVDQDIVYLGTADLADGAGLSTAETDVCEVCHTLTDHHQVDGTAPGGQSHFDGEDCTSCHTHPSGFAPSGGGQPLVGPHAAIPGSPAGDCAVCHGSSYFPGAVDNPGGLASVFCATCHDPATVADLHAHTVTGNTRFEYGVECDVCHDQHGWQITNIDGTDNLDYVRARISETLTVMDNTQVPPVEVVKTIDSDIVFDSRDDMANGDAFYQRDICVTCHTLTNHHQNDGDAPGGQSHYDGQVCTGCHEHPQGFAPPGDLSGPPLRGAHASMPGQAPQDCLVCHGLYPTTDEMKANSTEVCLACHSEAWTILAATPEHVHSSAVTGSTRFDYNVECGACHAPHGWDAEIGNVLGGDNIKYVRANVDEMITVVDNTVEPPPTITKEIDYNVVFTAESGPQSFSDGTAPFSEDICATCHTLTNHHRNDGSAPEQSHQDGEDCTTCHLHPEGFGGFGGGPHPQANTDCGNCHLRAEGEPDLVGIHGSDCGLCHTSGFSGTFLGPLGSWDGECRECHNPARPETGFMDTPTKGHRCVVCHGRQMGTRELEMIHKKHADETNCVTCHGFIPDAGVVIGSGNRQICRLCHDGGKKGSIEDIHEKHTKAGLSCLECHGGERPPVDVTYGPGVGGARVVCEICHHYERDSAREIHKKHVDMPMDCGACHADAELQDDRAPMPPYDDARRAILDRSGYRECRLCHGSESGSSQKVHKEHVADQWQWCFNCHEADDLRPSGDVPPVTEPAQSCILCHGSSRYSRYSSSSSSYGYSDSTPFNVHDKHSGKLKCYSCHQTRPQLFDWPRSWLGGVD